jgi:hypothetical protein
MKLVGKKTSAPQVAIWGVNRWGDGSVWGPAQPQQSGKIMPIKVAVNLRNLSPAQIAQKMDEHKAGITANATVFVDPDPDMTAFGAMISTLRAKMTAADTAIQAAHDAVADRDNTVAEAIAMVNNVAAFVEKTANKSDNPSATVGLANMDVKSEHVPVAARTGLISVKHGQANFPALTMIWLPAARVGGRLKYVVRMQMEIFQRRSATLFHSARFLDLAIR